MKTILNEWKRFLKETREDDLYIAGIILQALVTGNVDAPLMQKELQKQSERAIRTLKGVLKDPELEYDVYDTDTIYKGNRELHFLIGVPGSGKGYQYFESEEEFRSRAEQLLSLLREKQYVMPERIPLDYRRSAQRQGSEVYHSGGPGDAGLALPNAAFEKEDREELDANIVKWVDYHKSLWEGDPMEAYKSSQAVIPALEYFVKLYSRYDPYEEKYREALRSLIDTLRGASKPEVPGKSEYEVAKEYAEALKKEVEELTMLSRQTPKSPEHKKQIEQAKITITTKSKEYRDAKRKMRSVRAR